MNNHPLINPKTGKEEWISRSIAVLVFVFAKDKYGKTYILVVQRGKGTPDPEFVGAWCVPSGYLDFDETIIQAAQRELREETGLNFPTSDFKLVYINDNPKEDKRQNVSFRYLINSTIPVEDLSRLLTIKNSEKDEISDVKFLMIDETYDIINKWAFEHDKLINKYYYNLDNYKT